MLGVDFEVVDGGGWSTSWGDACELREGVVGSAEGFAWEQLTGGDEGLAVFGPEGVVGGGADWFGLAVNVQVEHIARRMLERGGDELAVVAGVPFELRAGLNGNHFRRTGGSHFRAI